MIKSIASSISGAIIRIEPPDIKPKIEKRTV